MEKKGKILIVDDNQDVLFALNLLLEPYVEKVKVTTQPSRVEHFMKVFEPDVILLDMNFRKDAISGQEGFDCLQEILTIKSDDVMGRAKAYEAIVKGDNLPKAGIPESLNVLLHELKGLALSVKLQ